MPCLCAAFQLQREKKICFSSNSKAVSAVKETLKQLGQRLAAPSALGGVNGLCHLYKQVSGGHRAGLGDVISQGSSVTRERVCFTQSFLSLNIFFFFCGMIWCSFGSTIFSQYLIAQAK